MCGIVGFAMNENVSEHLIKGLEKLEYRGYDSAGIAVEINGEISAVKTAGRISALKEKLKYENVSSPVGIAHTRWATHGEANEKNAHPILSENKKIAVVHNGIIENADEIKKELISMGVEFETDTDTEVISQLLMINYDGSLLSAVIKTVKKLKGSFAFAAVCSDSPGEIAAARYLSPLTAVKFNSGAGIASDISALGEYSDEFIYLDDSEIAVINRDEVKIYSFSGEEKEKTPQRADADLNSDGKDGYEHFMLKEIYEQPDAVKKTIDAYCKNGEISFGFDEKFIEKLKNSDRVYFTACGSAYHAGAAAELFFEKILKIPCRAVIASEMRYSFTPLDKKTLVIAISQSGETADTLASLKNAKESGCVTLSIVNVKDSYIAKTGENVIYTRAGRETAVATTKGYTTQLTALYMLGIYLAKIKKNTPDKELDEYENELFSLADMIKSTVSLSGYISRRAPFTAFEKDVFFIGRGVDFTCALEGSLKLKEITYIHSECLPAGELKHGTISLIERGTKVFAVAMNKRLADKTANGINEIKARGAYVICFTTEKLRDKFPLADEVVILEETNEFFAPAVTAPALQLWAYYSARTKGCDIDKPKNLAKSVTVE